MFPLAWFLEILSLDIYQHDSPVQLLLHVAWKTSITSESLPYLKSSDHQSAKCCSSERDVVNINVDCR
jgi:hypothetical protein